MSIQPQIRRRKVLKVVEDLDAFPKVPETCLETTSGGGTASITAVVIIVWLVILEFSYFLDTDYSFHFSPDTDLDSKLTISVDITVAMPCGIVGADIVDSTNQNVMKFGELEEEFVHFELNDKQKAYFQAKSNLNSYLREQYHSISNLLWKKDFINLYSDMPQLTREEKMDRGLANACRLYGKLELNKVAGNFHITAGKTLPLPRGHAHIAAFMSERDYNFSHRIYKFSFGDGLPAIVHPLEGDEKVAKSHHMLYQYFIQVVPTIVKTRFKTYMTYQYSVRELEREIDHDKGSHGISGVFFKYDMSGLKVEVTEESYPLWRFLVRLCAVIGGVYATIGMIYNHMSFLGCRLRKMTDTNNTKGYNSLNSFSYPESSKQSTANYNKQPPVASVQPPYVPVALNASFETPAVELVSQDRSTCDIPVSSLDVAEVTSSVGLPDILASHHSS